MYPHHIVLQSHLGIPNLGQGQTQGHQVVKPGVEQILQGRLAGKSQGK